MNETKTTVYRLPAYGRRADAFDKAIPLRVSKEMPSHVHAAVRASDATS
jgi:hypothetical protein